MNTDLAPDERALKEARATRYGVGLFRASSANGKLIVTNQRLIFRQLFQSVAYPLSHIRLVSEQRFLIVPVVQLDFLDGGTEQFSVFGVSEWIGIIERARAAAPLVPLANQVSAAPHASIANGGLIAVIVGLMALGGCMLVNILILLVWIQFR